jgi:hypothetical protein
VTLGSERTMHVLSENTLIEDSCCHFLQNSLLLEALWRLHMQSVVSLQELLERYYTNDSVPLTYMTLAV